MHFKQFLLLVIVTFIACSSAAATTNAAQTHNLVVESSREVVERRYLKVNEKTTDADVIDEERVGATTPSFKQLFGFLKLPKFQGFSQLPLLKQVNAIRKKFGSATGDAYLKWVRKRYNSNPQHFM
ncbi:Secreted RxLR effector peptide protein [Phytophthora palmivora]|uniref:RxLR effector protein n=1 Tax=Phytophthora palmivora TaxID=4796 RepID=A0A2P4YSH3_9STRA|nr:Secreted RxLR effector peptide protein [Phytophthora palmivora]